MRDIFVGWAREAGCAVEIDPVGNIFARRPGTDHSSLPPVAIGSHLDTQICGATPTGPPCSGSCRMCGPARSVEAPPSGLTSLTASGGKIAPV